MDPKTLWSQVAKSGQMKATSTSTSTSGSSFTGAATGGAWTSTGNGGGGAWTSSWAAGGGAWTSSGAAGGGAWATSECAVPPAWPSRTPYKSVPHKIGVGVVEVHIYRSWGVGEHGHLLGLWVEEHGHLLSIPCRLLGYQGLRTSPCHKNRGRSRGSAHLPDLGVGEHGHLLVAAGGGAWASSERPVPPAWPSRTLYKSVPQRSEPESWKPTKTNEQSSHRVLV